MKNVLPLVTKKHRDIKDQWNNVQQVNDDHWPNLTVLQVKRLLTREFFVLTIHKIPWNEVCEDNTILLMRWIKKEINLWNDYNIRIEIEDIAGEMENGVAVLVCYLVSMHTNKW